MLRSDIARIGCKLEALLAAVKLSNKRDLATRMTDLATGLKSPIAIEPTYNPAASEIPSSSGASMIGTGIGATKGVAAAR
jgi:hypothetical protein